MMLTSQRYECGESKRFRGAAKPLLMGALLCALWAPAWSLDLKEAYEAAVQYDATLRAARAARASAQEKLPQAKAQLRPTVSLSASRNHNDLNRTQANILGQPTTTQESYYSYNQALQLRQALFKKPLWSSLEQAEFLVREADANLEKESQNLAVRVTGAYLEALLAQDQLDLVNKQKEFATRQLDGARKALLAGSGIRTDIDEAQAKLDLSLAQELEAAQHVDFTQRQLAVLTGRPLSQLARVEGEKLQLSAAAKQSLDQWLELAEQSSPELMALKARVEATKLEVEKAQGGHYPTLDLVAQWQRSGSENVTTPSSSYTNKVIGLQLNLPLYSGGYADSLVAQALAEQTRSEEVYEATRRDLLVRIHKEYRGATEGVLKIKALEQAQVSAVQLVLSSKRSFEAGARTVIDTLNAEQQLQAVRRDLAQARYAYLISTVRLVALAGGDVVQTIAELNAGLGKSE
jgi:outer membrane protein/protease secretion system outer membrane protein